MIFDADILSVLGKIGRTDLLRKLFPEAGFTITFEVYNELLRAKEAGYDFVDDILKHGLLIINIYGHNKSLSSDRKKRLKEARFHWKKR